MTTVTFNVTSFKESINVRKTKMCKGIAVMNEYYERPLTAYLRGSGCQTAAGGTFNLHVHEGDVRSLALPDKSVDVVTLLEVLEHIPDVAGAVRNAVRMARRHVVVTVPSQKDDNPEHIHLLTKERLRELFGAAGCGKLNFGGVPGHTFMVATC